MRGTPSVAHPVGCAGGIIPAHAGNTALGSADSLSGRDHPRACGEHLLPRQKAWGQPGSSPRMRGTPTNIGGLSRRTRDHPRACGEHWTIYELIPFDGGSSPRMRGTRFGASAVIKDVGIIPAHAGNTSRMRLRVPLRRDHPRACGEHFNAVRSATSPQGSSPRMRGTQRVRLRRLRDRGIIPAHAGNTDDVGLGDFDLKDHPRACGEHRGPRMDHCTAKGSSPRMRGTPVRTQRPAGS